MLTHHDWIGFTGLVFRKYEVVSMQITMTNLLQIFLFICTPTYCSYSQFVKRIYALLYQQIILFEFPKRNTSNIHFSRQMLNKLRLIYWDALGYSTWDNWFDLKFSLDGPWQKTKASLKVCLHVEGRIAKSFCYSSIKP